MAKRPATTIKTNKTANKIRQAVKKELAKNNVSIKQVRKDVAKLKKAGLVSKKIDARSYVPTEYMMRKLKKNADIIEGRAFAIKAPKKVIEKYTSKDIFQERQGRLIVPRHYANQKTNIKRGHISIQKQLKNGQEERIILPFKPTDFEMLGKRLQDDPTLEGLMQPDEMIGFRLDGFNMQTFGFPTPQLLGEYLLRHYSHIFNNKNANADAPLYFELIRFQNEYAKMNEGPEEYKGQWSYRSKPKKRDDEWSNLQLRKKDAARKAKARAKESEAKRRERLAKQRIRTAQNRQRKFNES